MAHTDLAELRKQCITSLYLCTENISKYLDSEKDAEFEKLSECVKDYCAQEAEEDVAIQALEKTKRETEASNVDTLEERFQENLAALARKRLNVSRHPYMKEFNSKMQKKVQQTGSNLDESDIAITQTNNQYIDPIAKRPIQDPVKNTVCGHIYEKDVIMDAIMKKPRVKCPVAGCGNKGPICKEDLFADEELRFRVTLTSHSTMIQERSITNLDDSNISNI